MKNGLAVTNNRSMLILGTLMVEAIESSETSVLTEAIGRKIPEHAIIHIQP
jgi:hypothetical protein